MPAGDKVRSKISLVETAIKSAGADNAINAVVDVLKEIARALDDLRRRRTPKRTWRWLVPQKEECSRIFPSEQSNVGRKLE